MTTAAVPAAGACPCGSTRSYAACCKPLHDGAPAKSAEALMRSRYVAYALGLAPYVRSTWHASTRPRAVDLDDPDAPNEWLGLEVRRHEQTGKNQAIVEFVARHRDASGGVAVLHEVSRFVLERGRWFYVDGEFPKSAALL